MRNAKGFVTDDGTFFEVEEEAKLYEAELALRKGLTAYNSGIDHEKFIAVLQTLMPVIGRYVDAYNATSPTEPDPEIEDREETGDSRASEAVTGTGHVSGVEEDLAALLKLPVRGPGHVPNMGGSPRPAEVQDRRSQHGPRVRRADASSVRRRKDMATKQDTKA